MASARLSFSGFSLIKYNSLGFNIAYSLHKTPGFSIPKTTFTSYEPYKIQPDFDSLA